MEKEKETKKSLPIKVNTGETIKKIEIVRGKICIRFQDGGVAAGLREQDIEGSELIRVPEICKTGDGYSITVTEVRKPEGSRWYVTVQESNGQMWNFYLPDEKRCKKVVEMAEKLVGKTFLTKEGQKLEVYGYSYDDCFEIKLEDSTKMIASYSDIIHKRVKNPYYCVGEHWIAEDGTDAVIVEMYKARYVLLQFADGTKETFFYPSLKNGNAVIAPKHVGEEYTAHNGQKMKIVCWRTDTDIDVEFEDGTVNQHVFYKNVINGRVANDNYKPYTDPYGMSFHNMTEMANYWKENHNSQITPNLLMSRIYSGWNIGEALTSPKNMSLGELRVRTCLLSMGITNFEHNITIKTLFKKLNAQKEYESFLNEYLKNYRNEITKDITRAKLEHFKYDFTLFKGKKVTGLIEVDGEQHFKIIRLFTKTFEEFFFRCDSDRMKNGLAEVNKIPLLRIRFDQLDTDTVKAMLTDFIGNSEKYVTQHNTYLSEDEYWEPLYNQKYYNKEQRQLAFC